MSLINQMLKDIDKRQGHAGSVSPSSAGIPLAVSRRRSGVSAGGWLLGGALLVAVVAGVYWFRPAAQPAPAPVAVAPAPAAVPAPAAPVAPMPAAEPAAQAVVTPAPKPEPKPEIKPEPKPEPKPAVAVAPAPAPTASPVTPVAKEAKATKSEPVAETVKPVKPAPVVAAAPAEVAAKPEKRAEPTAAGQVTRVLSAEQRADNAYREATTLLRQGRSLEAQKALQQALADLPTHQDARLMYAQLLQGDGRSAEARSLLSEGMTLRPQAFAFNAALAQMQLLSRDTEQAVTTLERGLSAAGDNAPYHALMATALQQQSRHAEAVQHYVVALRQQPDSSNWLVGLGVSLQAQGNTQGAAEAYQRALDLGLPASLSQFTRERLQQVNR